MSETKEMYTFVEEIKKLMVGYGDYVNPEHRSAEIIEMILRQQMHSLLVQLYNNANLRNGENIGFEDVLFLMRVDKVKLRRLLKFIKYKDDHDIDTLLSEDKAKSANVTSDDKTKPVNASVASDDKMKVVDVNVTSDKTKPVGTNATSDTQEKPVSGTATCNNEEKPVLTNAACNAKENPKLVNETCNAKEKSINTNSVKEPATGNSVSNSKVEPVATSSLWKWDVNEEPIVEYPKVVMIEIKEIEKPKIQFKRRLKDCLRFLKYLDHTEELCSLLDDTGYDDDETEFERQMALNQLTIFKDQAQYLAYEEHRRSTYITEIFTAPTFMDWLYRDHVIDLRPTKLAFEMIGYLAHETVATIIQLCLILKRGRETDYLKRIETVPSCNAEYPNIQMFNYVPPEEEDDYYYPPLPRPLPKPPTPPPPPKRQKTLFHPKRIFPYDLQEVILRFYNQKSFFLVGGDLDPIQAAKKLFCC